MTVFCFAGFKIAVLFGEVKIEKSVKTDERPEKYGKIRMRVFRPFLLPKRKGPKKAAQNNAAARPVSRLEIIQKECQPAADKRKRLLFISTP